MSLRRCPRCPQRMLPGASFCPRCGKALALVPPPRPSPRSTAAVASTHPDLEPLPAGGFLAVVASVIAGGLGIVLLLAAQRGDAFLLVVGLFLVGVSLAALATAVSCMGSDSARGRNSSTASRPLSQRVRSGEQPLHSARFGDA